MSNSILSNVGRVKSFIHGYPLRYSSKLRYDIHDYSLLIIPYFYKGNLLGLSIGTINEEPKIFFRVDPSNEQSLLSLLSGVSDILSEYFISLENIFSHPQIIFPDLHSAIELRLYLSYIINLKSSKVNFDIDRVRHVARLLAYPLIDRWDFIGQQSFVILTKFAIDHYSFPLSDYQLEDIKALSYSFDGNNNFISSSSSQFLDIDKYISILLYNKEKNVDDFTTEHIIGNIIRGEMLNIYFCSKNVFNRVFNNGVMRCRHLDKIHFLENDSFFDYMKILRHHLNRLRKVQDSEREFISTNFLNLWDRQFFKIKNDYLGSIFRDEFLGLSLRHDLVFRIESRINKSILNGIVIAQSESNITILSQSLPKFFGKNLDIYCLDGGTGKVIDYIFSIKGIEILISWNDSFIPIGSSIDFSNTFYTDKYIVQKNIFVERLGKNRLGEPWTHLLNSKNIIPDFIYRPYQISLSSYLRDYYLE